MRIVHISTDLQAASGVGTFVRRVQGELVKLGVNSQVVTSREEFFDCLKLLDSSQSCNSVGLIQHSIPPSPPHSDTPTLQHSSTQTFKHSHVDLILHLHGMWLGLHHAAAKWARDNGIPVVWSTHGMTAPWSLRHKWWKKLPAWWLYQKRDLKGAAVIHCTTELEVGWNQALGLKKTCVVPLGTDLPESELECRVGVRERNDRTLLFVGRIYPVKAIDRILKAFQMVPPAGWRLRIVGPDQDGHMAELMSLCDRLGLSFTTPEQSKNSRIQQSNNSHISFVGPKFGVELSAEYARCDCAILVSHTENFGATIVDAMSHGKPVIAGTKTPWKIVAERGGGWWVDNDPAMLAKVMEEMMALSDDERAAMGAKGRQLVEEKYTWSAVGKAMVAAYENLLKRS